MRISCEQNLVPLVHKVTSLLQSASPLFPGHLDLYARHILSLPLRVSNEKQKY